MKVGVRILVGAVLAGALALALAAPPHPFLEDLKRRLGEPRHVDGDISALITPYLPQGATPQAAKQFCIDIGAVVAEVPKEVNNRGPYFWCWRDTVDLRKPSWGKRELVIAIYYQQDHITSIVAITV